MAMITLTFEPTNPEQAVLLGQFLPEYMRAGILRLHGEPEQVKAVVERALTAQQQADLAAAEANRADDAAREEMQAKRDTAKKSRKPAATPAAAEAAPTEAAQAAPAAESPSEGNAAAAPSTPEAAAASTASSSEPAVSLEQVRAKLASLSQAGKAADVKALIAKFGAAKLTDIPAEKFAEVLAAAEEI